MTCAKQVLIFKLIDEIVWSPTNNEVKALYPKEQWENMLTFYKNLRESRHKVLIELQAKQ